MCLCRPDTVRGSNPRTVCNVITLTEDAMNREWFRILGSPPTCAPFFRLFSPFTPPRMLEPAAFYFIGLFLSAPFARYLGWLIESGVVLV